MGKYTLHYAKLNTSYIETMDFQTLDSLVIETGLMLCVADDKECVYLMTYNSGKDRREYDITISTKKHVIQDAINYYDSAIVNLFIQEYKSFESAYKTALSMQESSKLCYSLQ